MEQMQVFPVKTVANTKTGNASITVEPFQRVTILQATGTISLRLKSGEPIGPLSQGNEFDLGEVTPGRATIEVLNTVTEDVIIVFSIKARIKGFGIGGPPNPPTQMFDDGGIGHNLRTRDLINLATAPSDTQAAGSFPPSSSFGTTLTGETWVTVRLDGGTYVSGASAQPLLFTAGGGTGIGAEMVDMSTGENVQSITTPGIWYKIKTQGGSLLQIPTGTLLGSGPGGAMNFSLERGYSEWQDNDRAHDVQVLNIPTLNDANPHFSGPIRKPKNAKGLNIWLEVATPDPGSNIVMLAHAGNPVTGTMSAMVSGFGSYVVANGNPQGWFCNADGHSLGSSGSPMGNLSYGVSQIPELFELGVVDTNGGIGTPDLGVTIDLEWIY